MLTLRLWAKFKVLNIDIPIGASFDPDLKVREMTKSIELNREGTCVGTNGYAHCVDYELLIWKNYFSFV